MADQQQTVIRARTESILETNSVIRNTYILLAASLGFSALMAYVAMITNAKSLGVATFLIYFGLIFLLIKFFLFHKDFPFDFLQYRNSSTTYKT